MIPTLEQRSRLPLATGAARLLAVVADLPATESERYRLLTAVSLAESEAWLRVELRVSGDPREILGLGESWATPHDLAHVLEIADTVAQAYDHPSLGTEHIAIALVISARVEPTLRTELIATVSEAFNLGELEAIDQIADIHMRRRSRAEMHDDEAAQLKLVLGNPWWGIRQAAPLIHPVLRLALVIALIVLAVQSGNVWAWLIAAAAAVPFRDPKLMDWPDSPRYPRGIPRRIPSLLILSGISALLSLPVIAIVLFAAHIVFEGVGILLDRIMYRHLSTEGTALEGIQHARRLIGIAFGQIYRGSSRNRFLKWLLPLIPVAYAALRWKASVYEPLLQLVAHRLPTDVLKNNAESVVRLVALQAILGFVLFGVLLWLSASGYFVLAILAGVAVTTLHHWPPILPALVVTLGWLIFLFDWWAYRRIPSGRFPIPLFLPRHRGLSGFGAQVKVRRRLRRGRPVAALSVFERWLTSLSAEQRMAPSRVQMVHAYLLLEAGRPGEAWELRDSFPPSADVFRGYVVARTLFLLNRLEDANAAALTVNNRMVRSPYRVPKSLRVHVALTLVEISARVTPEDLVGLTILKLIPKMASGGRVQEPVRMLRYAATAFADIRPVLAERCALGASGLAMLAQEERATRRERNRESTLTVEGASATCQAARYAFGNGNATVEALSTWRTGTEILFREGSPVEVAYELRAMAGHLDAVRGFESAAYRARLDVVGVLNTIRHELRSREDRLAWWETFREVLDDAILAAFTGKDWATLAELIEYGRLQSEAAMNPSLALRKSLFVRVAGRSVLQDGFWEKAGEPAPAYDIEIAAAVAGGPLTWWWSTWESHAHMYWALVRPGSPPKGGRIPMAELASPLASLRDAVPVELPGEPPDLRRRRLRDSPLIHGPIGRERELAADLIVLLPTALRLAILNSAAPVSLAIAPDVAFAHVPWASISVDGGDGRLIEHARVTIAPPVAALAEIAKNGGAEAASIAVDPIRLAVLNPGNDLPGAASLTDALGPEVALLTAADRPSRNAVTSALRALPRNSTWVFAGHTVSVPPDQRAGLSLRGKGVYDPEFTIAGDALPLLPRAAILLACDSGDLGNATAGEWSTLGPAMLRSGAERVIATAFPIRDVSSVDRQIVARVETQPLGEALRQAQLDQLITWKTTRGRKSPPADWAGHVMIGAADPSRRLPQHLGPSQVWVASALFELMDASTAVAQQNGRSVVQIEDVWVAVLEWGWESIGRTTDITLRILARTMRGRRRVEDQATSSGLSKEVVALLSDAVHLSRSLHHRILLEDHVIAACFARNDSVAQIARLLTGLDPRTIDGASFMTERNDGGWNRTGVPAARALPSDAVAEICRLAGATLTSEERWYDSDR